MEIEKLEELKGCPFCGELPEIHKHFKCEMWRLMHRCKIVGAISFEWTENKGNLIECWNTRA